MPIFEYECNQCKKEFEKLVFAGEDKNISCPECKSVDVVKKNERLKLHGKQ
jgi:putative FmdB family regulatory protein